MKCLYWATAILALPLDICYTVYSIRYQFFFNIPTITSCIVNHTCDIPSNTSIYQDEVHTLVAKVTIIPLAVFTELLASIYAVKTHFVTQRRLRSWGHCCHSWKHYLLQTFHVLALWNILIMVQLFTMIAIPISGLLIIRPQLTIFYLLFFVTLLSGLIFMAAYLLHHCQQSRRRMWCHPKHFGKKFIHLVLIVATLGLIITLLAQYELMLKMQVHIETGLKGILLSLLPILSTVCTWMVLKKKVSEEGRQYLNGQTLEKIAEEQQSMKITILQCTNSFKSSYNPCLHLLQRPHSRATLGMMLAKVVLARTVGVKYIL